MRAGTWPEVDVWGEQRAATVSQGQREGRRELGEAGEQEGHKGAGREGGDIPLRVEPCVQLRTPSLLCRSITPWKTRPGRSGESLVALRLDSLTGVLSTKLHRVRPARSDGHMPSKNIS